mgnify:CR=1 FL=1|tara:strand:+ start:77 stop:472 length:396 start_codon:yes stop_codon:yes gene_type:complete
MRQLQEKLNRIAQGLDEPEPWFSELSDTEKIAALNELCFMLKQSGSPPDEEALNSALEATGVSPGATAVNLVRKQRTYKIPQLPTYEHAKSFPLLISLYSFSDNRRREKYCAEGCSHWWHQDPGEWQRFAW